MTKKDYVLISGSFKASLEKIDQAELTPQDKKAGLLGVKIAVADLCYELKLNNPRFDSARFLLACSITE